MRSTPERQLKKRAAHCRKEYMCCLTRTLRSLGLGGDSQDNLQDTPHSNLKSVQMEVIDIYICSTYRISLIGTRAFY